MRRRQGHQRRTNRDFGQVEIDCYAEFWEAVRLGGHSDLEEGFAQITHHRTYSRPKPPVRAISTIHKAKGLECDAVVVMPCDGQTFPDSQEARRLLYVALSRAKNQLLLVVSRSEPSPGCKSGPGVSDQRCVLTYDGFHSSHPTNTSIRGGVKVFTWVQDKVRTVSTNASSGS